MRTAIALLAVVAAAFAQQDKPAAEFAQKLRRAIVHVRAVDEALLEAQRLRRKNNAEAVRELRRLRIHQPYTLYASGVIVSADGKVVTQALHPRARLVVTVTTHDGKEHAARIVGTDPRSNLAVLDLEGTGHHHLALAEAATARGADVHIAGHVPRGPRPVCLRGRVVADHTGVRLVDTYGVSKTRRELHIGSAFAVLTERALPHAGSACVDGEGRLLGVVIGSMPRVHRRPDGRRTLVQIQFALPAARVARITKNLETHERVIRARFGVLYAPVQPEVRAHFELPSSACAVTKVQADGPAYKADLRVNDIILAIDGQGFRDCAELGQAMEDKTPGKPVVFRVLREGKELDLTATPTE